MYASESLAPWGPETVKAVTRVSSLDPEAEPESEQLWLEEAERRLDELCSNRAASVPADEVFERARSTIR